MINRMMRTREAKVALGLLFAAGLGLTATACKEPAASADGVTANGLTADGKTAQAEAATLPDFAPVYPGSTIKTHITDTTLGDAKGTMVVLETTDSIQTVIGFYDSRAKSIGMVPEMVVNEDDSAIRIYGGGDNPAGKGGMISVSPSDDGKGTSIVITAGQSAIGAVEKMAVPEPARLQ